MKILVLAHSFAPYNTVGAIRLTKITKHLYELGHDVHVFSAKPQAVPSDLPLELPSERVTYTSWFNLTSPVEMLLGGKKKVASRGYAAGGGWKGKVLKWSGDQYKTWLGFPDNQIGWLPAAERAAERLFKSWKPDLIYATATPYTTLVIANRLSRRFRIPWVAELRDLWVDNPYYPFSERRKKIEGWLEKRVLKTAAGFVTVSEPLAENLRNKYGQPTQVVLNAIDPEEYDFTDSPPSDGRFRIVHTGTIYPGRRDPSPLFAAIKNLGEKARDVRVTFVGRNIQSVRELARAHGVSDAVEIKDAVSRREAIQMQREADLLLLLLWDDPQEEGVFSGKVFEYLGNRRPILLIGPERNVAAQLIRDRQAGFVFQDASAIGATLARFLDEKARGERLPDLGEYQLEGLRRGDQVRILEKFLLERVAAR